MTAPGYQLTVDWKSCKGHGLCAEMLPEHITLDDWGYPIIENPIPTELKDLAERTESVCPALALRLSKLSR